ncbi:MAG: STAS domain-containing protein [Candidatus Sulfotelmatobacter sp.]
MFILFELAEADKVLRVTLKGEMTDDSVMELWSTGVPVAASFPAYRSIVDLSGITRFDVSTRTINRLAKTDAPNFSNRVFVAPMDVVYGTTRMFQVLTEGTRKNVHVVRTMDEAYKLLGLESPKFVAVDRAK